MKRGDMHQMSDDEIIEGGMRAAVFVVFAAAAAFAVALASAIAWAI